MKLDKYKKNLRIADNVVFSYGTPVAEINHTEGIIFIPEWWSMTTSKHINYVATVYGYDVVKGY